MAGAASRLALPVDVGRQPPLEGARVEVALDECPATVAESAAGLDLGSAAGAEGLEAGAALAAELGARPALGVATWTLHPDALVLPGGNGASVLKETSTN